MSGCVEYTAHGVGMLAPPDNNEVCETEYEPCKICGKIPKNRYDEDDYMAGGGTCRECFKEGAKSHFVEYLDTLPASDKTQFYCGDCEGGYAFESGEILYVMEHEYKGYVGSQWFNANAELETWLKFINDGDADHFGQWLIEKNRK